MSAGEYRWIQRGNKWVFTNAPEAAVRKAPAAQWPLVCHASGVHAEQAGELRQFLAERGCPTEVTPGGDPVYRSAEHRRRALRARGLCDRSSYD